MDESCLWKAPQDNAQPLDWLGFVSSDDVLDRYDDLPDDTRLCVHGHTKGPHGPAACGIVITSATNQTLLQVGYHLGDIDQQAVHYHALLHGLRRAADLNIRELIVFSNSDYTVNQVTGADTVAHPIHVELLERVQMALLTFDRWQIRSIGPAGHPKAQELSEQALTNNNHVGDTRADQPPSPTTHPADVTAVIQDHTADRQLHTSSPPADHRGDMYPVIVTVTQPSRHPGCPLHTAGQQFLFDGTTPAGMCLHAASAVLPTVVAMSYVGPETEHTPDRPADQEISDVIVRCPHPGCRAVLSITFA